MKHEKRRHDKMHAEVTPHPVGDAVRRGRPSKLSEHRQIILYVLAEVQKRLDEDRYTVQVRDRLF